MSKSQKPKKEKMHDTASQKAVQSKSGKNETPEITFPLGIKNYIFILIGLLFIIMGYIFMAGDKNIFNFTKLNLSVIFVIGGFLFVVFAIMYKGNKK